MTNHQIELHLHVLREEKGPNKYKNLTRIVMADEPFFNAYLVADYIVLVPSNADGVSRNGTVTSRGVHNNTLIINLEISVNDEDERTDLIRKIRKANVNWQDAQPVMEAQ